MFPTYTYVPIELIINKFIVLIEIRLGLKINKRICVESWLIPFRDSLVLCANKTRKLPGIFDYVLLRTLKQNRLRISESTITEWEMTISKEESCSSLYDDPCLNVLKCGTMIVIKTVPDQATFSLKNVARISSYMENNQLLFVTKHILILFLNLNFCIHENCWCRFDLAQGSRIGAPMFICRQEAKGILEMKSCCGFKPAFNLNDCTISATVYFDIFQNKFADSVGNERIQIVNSKRSFCDTLSSRPVSLQPCGTRQLENNMEVTLAPLHRTVIAQASDDLEERSSLQTDSRFGYPTDVSIDQYIFYQPRLTPTRQAQQHHSATRDNQANAAYGQFVTTEQRRASFTNRWPHRDQTTKIELMIKFGFFFTGNGDLIRCYCCGIGLKDWSELDDPLLEHVRYSPDCQFLIDTIPTTELARIKASFLPNNVISTRESITHGQVGQIQMPSLAVGGGTSSDETVLSIQPRNPQYRVKAVRISSFTKWPRDLTQTPEELADAGFFYTGYNDIVRCYVCDGGLQKWSPEDNAWVEHARWFPHCAYVRQVKGLDFIELVRLSAEQQELEQTHATGSANGYTAARTEDAITYISNLEISTRNEGVPSNKDTRREILKTVKDIVPDISEEKLMKAIAIMERRGEDVTKDSVVLYVTEENKGYSLDTMEQNAVSFFEKEPETLKELIDETEKLRSVVKCADCKQNDVNCLFLPCAHHTLCIPCSANVSTCPRCNKRIKNKIKTFMS